ncbi:unnamed protein product [Sphenostylis stenocarpa]|uniref:ABC transporter domain-containing protein n=1 Tax=Sphenostylis stenocarpa TaxID=92480 RepID=A0AA86RX24_9FABA|nr:unnamed protein product [Sphenostylis stenocarpa]
MKSQGIDEDKLQLLHDASGAFRPGVLTALMGVSGAGKTTLMDVLAGRKTGGYIEGNISISGYPKNQATFARVSSYCEQNDIHSPNVTVYESLLFSAWLRLPSDVNAQTRKMFVEEIMELIELNSIKDALVGLPGINGLTTEQRKRLTIAVELVANPSIIFMDEPTSGLDARAAAIVMRTVRNTVDTGRTVVCTIHQPSIDIFEAFDELLLMKSGGQIIYAGPLGHHSQKLAIAGVPKIKDGYNPATWMLQISSPSIEAQLGIDFADIYNNSTLYRRNQELIKELSSPPRGSNDLHFPTKYSQSFFVQCKACFWKQYWSYWRNPPYNAVRFFFSIVVGIVYGIIFWNKAKHVEKQQDLFDLLGAMYTAVMFLGTGNAMGVQPIVDIERTVLYRERAAGMYSTLPYAISQVAVEAIYNAIQTTIYSVFIYSMMGFEWKALKFLWFFYIMLMCLIYYTLYGMMIVALTPSFHIAVTFNSFFLTIWNAFCGFIIPRTQIPVWWRWFYWASPNSWTLYGIVTSQLGDENAQVEIPGAESMGLKELLKENLGYDYHFLPVVAVVHLGWRLNPKLRQIWFTPSREFDFRLFLRCTTPASVAIAGLRLFPFFPERTTSLVMNLPHFSLMLLRFRYIPLLWSYVTHASAETCSFGFDFVTEASGNLVKLKRKILAVKSSLDSESFSSAIAEPDKVLIPQDQDNSASLTDQLETPDINSEDAHAVAQTALRRFLICENLEDLTMEDEDKYNIGEADSSYKQIEDGQGSVVSSQVEVDISVKTSVSVGKKVKIPTDDAKPKNIPLPGTGQKIYEIDPSLLAHHEHLDFRYGQYKRLHDEINKHEGGLDTFSRGYEKFGFIRRKSIGSSVGQKGGSTWFQLSVAQEILAGQISVISTLPHMCTDGGKLPGRGQFEDSEQGLLGLVQYATGITYREWAPGAKSAALIGDFNNWNPNADVMIRRSVFFLCYGDHADLTEDFGELGLAIAPYLTGLVGTQRVMKPADVTAVFLDVNVIATNLICSWFLNEFGVWEIFLPNNVDGSPPIPHGSRVKIRMNTSSGFKDSIPAWIKFSVQAPGEIPYSGIYYDPAEEEKYVFKHPQPKRPKSLRIYESHIGMSSPSNLVKKEVRHYKSTNQLGSAFELRGKIKWANKSPSKYRTGSLFSPQADGDIQDDVLPRIKRLGYNAVQIMAIQEHSYYASFGYHVTNFFAPSSRFGTPEELKSLIDRAHELGLLVLMDIVHSHASNNTLDGLNMFDGTDSHYFHPGSRGYHWMWDSRLFNYGSWEVLRFLLSNARWWLDEYKFDGFRFDGVTSMMYTHHGLQVAFTGNYNEYFGFATDVDAVIYLMLVNDLIHGLFPEAVTIGEDVSGMPTFCLPTQDGGVGFDYRLQMAIADKWIEILK